MGGWDGASGGAFSHLQHLLKEGLLLHPRPLRAAEGWEGLQRSPVTALLSLLSLLGSPWSGTGSPHGIRGDVCKQAGRGALVWSVVAELCTELTSGEALAREASSSQ